MHFECHVKSYLAHIVHQMDPYNALREAAHVAVLYLYK